MVGLLGIGFAVLRRGTAQAGFGSSAILRSVADLRSLQAVFADGAAHDALRSLCGTHGLWSIETTTQTVAVPSACDGGPPGPGPAAERLRHTFTFVREPGVSSRVFEAVYSTCGVNAQGHIVDRVAQAFRTRGDLPSASIADDTISFRIFCSGIQDPQVTEAIADTLRGRSITTSRVEFVELDGSDRIYALSFIVRDPFDGREEAALRFLARYTAEPDSHIFFSRD
jgi:hypothetical protein